MIQTAVAKSKPTVLLVTGSVNQTTQMHQIASHLLDCDCFFSQIYADSPAINWAMRRGIAEHTVLAGKFRIDSEAYLRQHQLRIDYRGQARHYDLVVMCTDMLLPANVRATRTLFVQEGMVDPVTPLSWLVKYLRLPRYWAIGTSLNGSSNLCDIYCVASEGYRDFFNYMGTDQEKMVVTGIPNYDNLDQHRHNDFPHHDYVMVATTDMRETFRTEDRPAFIRRCVAMAGGRQLLFKLHPNEVVERAEREIRENTPPGTMIYRSGNTNAMIANCAELITQYSTVVYTGLALGKPVHSYFDLDTLKRQMPIQNGGTSARQIADVCRAFVTYNGPRQTFAQHYAQHRVSTPTAYAVTH